MRRNDTKLDLAILPLMSQSNEFDLLLLSLFKVNVGMEKPLDIVLEDLVNTDRVVGCVVSDKQGLCLGSRGIASPESSGLITAISDFAKKLHPNESGPTIVLENNEKQYIIQSNDKLVVSIQKKVPA